MAEIFTERTIDSIEGIELKRLIMKSADESHSEGDIKGAADLYRLAAQMDENRVYRRETVCKYF